MKIILVLSMIVSVIACNSNRAFRGSNESKYLILGIDSINSYYLIFATRDKLKFEIVSKKVASASGEKIKIGESYYLNLISVSSNKPIKNLDVLPENRSLVSCYHADDSTIICYKEKYVKDFYKVENIKGFYLGK